MIKEGRLCIKLAGRDAGQKCVIIEVLDNNFVMIDGQTRRRKCNIRHLEPLKEEIKVKKGESHTAVVAEFKKLGIEITEKKPKEKKERPKKQRKVKEKPVKEKKPAAEKKADKKEVAKKEVVKEEKPVTQETKSVSGPRNSKGVSREKEVKKAEKK